MQGFIKESSFTWESRVEDTVPQGEGSLREISHMNRIIIKDALLCFHTTFFVLSYIFYDQIWIYIYIYLYATSFQSHPFSYLRSTLNSGCWKLQLLPWPVPSPPKPSLFLCFVSQWTAPLSPALPKPDSKWEHPWLFSILHPLDSISHQVSLILPPKCLSSPSTSTSLVQLL